MSNLDKFDGPGYVLTKEDHITFIDIDHCVAGGQLDNDAKEVVDRFDSYSEVSISDTGVHILVGGNIPKGRKKGRFEIYDDTRYVTVSGNHILGTPHTIEERQDVLTDFYEEVFGDPTEASLDSPKSPLNTTGLTDQEVISRAEAAQGGDLFKRLFWDGDWASEYSSQSEADLRLCGMLSFWVGGDPAQVDRIFRRSGLYRRKWDVNHGESTYGELTITQAMSGTQSVYAPMDLTPRQVKPDGIEEHIIEELDMVHDRSTDIKVACGYDVTETGNTLRMLHLFGKDIRYCYDRKIWYAYDGRRWVADAYPQVMELAKETVNRIYSELGFVHDDDKKKENQLKEDLFKWARKSQTKYILEAMEKLARTDQRVNVLASVFDSQSHLLNFPNGTLDLNTREFREHRREDMLSLMTKVPLPSPEKESTYFYKTLFDALPLDVIVYLQRKLGSYLEYTTKHKEFMVLYGSPYAGKSSLTQSVYKALGDYARPFKISLLQKLKFQQSANAAEPALMELVGARLAWTEETQESMVFDDAMLRSLTSSGERSSRDMYEKQRTILLGMTFVIETNSAPTMDIQDDWQRDAMLRRLRVVPFLNSIPPEQCDDKILTAMTEDPNELQMALAWVVQGYWDYLDYGIKTPASVDQSKEEYERDVNPLAEFVKEEVIFDDSLVGGYEARTLLKSLMERHAETADPEEVKKLKKPKTFSTHFKRIAQYFAEKAGVKIYTKHSHDGAMWYNVRLRTEDDLELTDDKHVVTKSDESDESYSFFSCPHENLSWYIDTIQNKGFCVTEPQNAPASKPKESNYGQENGELAAFMPSEVGDESGTNNLDLKQKPPLAELAQSIYGLLRDTKQAFGGRAGLDTTLLQEQVCVQLRESHPEWSDYDLEGAYTHFANNDPKISELITEITYT